MALFLFNPPLPPVSGLAPIKFCSSAKDQYEKHTSILVNVSPKTVLFCISPIISMYYKSQILINEKERVF
jgi:hypothetical protein